MRLELWWFPQCLLPQISGSDVRAAHRKHQLGARLLKLHAWGCGARAQELRGVMLHVNLVLHGRANDDMATAVQIDLVDSGATEKVYIGQTKTHK